MYEVKNFNKNVLHNTALIDFYTYTHNFLIFYTQTVCQCGWTEMVVDSSGMSARGEKLIFFIFISNSIFVLNKYKNAR